MDDEQFAKNLKTNNLEWEERDHNGRTLRAAPGILNLASRLSVQKLEGLSNALVSPRIGRRVKLLDASQNCERFSKFTPMPPRCSPIAHTETTSETSSPRLLRRRMTMDSYHLLFTNSLSSISKQGPVTSGSPRLVKRSLSVGANINTDTGVPDTHRLQFEKTDRVSPDSTKVDQSSYQEQHFSKPEHDRGASQTLGSVSEAEETALTPQHIDDETGEIESVIIPTEIENLQITDDHPETAILGSLYDDREHERVHMSGHMTFKSQRSTHHGMFCETNAGEEYLNEERLPEYQRQPLTSKERIHEWLNGLDRTAKDRGASIFPSIDG